jgi:hypothetical protein
MIYLFPAILTPTILFTLWYALNTDMYTYWRHREAQRLMLQKQFFQNSPY